MNTQRFFGRAVAAAGGAGLESYCELWNPAGSGRTVKITRATVNTADTAIKVKYHTAQQGSAGVAGTIGNKHLGGVASVLELYGHSLASVLGTQILTLPVVAATITDFYWEDGPIVLDPGHSIIFECAIDNLVISYLDLIWHEIRDLNV